MDLVLPWSPPGLETNKKLPYKTLESPRRPGRSDFISNEFMPMPGRQGLFLQSVGLIRALKGLIRPLRALYSVFRHCESDETPTIRSTSL